MSEQIKTLAAKLGISDKQLQTLRVKYRSDDAVLRRLKRWEEETRDRVRLLGKSGGYTERVGFALKLKAEHEGSIEMEPEAVDEMAQHRITKDARAREREAAGELVAAVEDFRAALKERLEDNPEFMRLAGRDVWLVRSKLDRLVNNAKRRAA